MTEEETTEEYNSAWWVPYAVVFSLNAIVGLIIFEIAW